MMRFLVRVLIKSFPLPVVRACCEHFALGGAIADLVGFSLHGFGLFVAYEGWFVWAGKLAFVLGGYAAIQTHKEEARQKEEQLKRRYQRPLTKERI
jgi:hypothetical protein